MATAIEHIDRLADAVGERLAGLEAQAALGSSSAAVQETAILEAIERLRLLWERDVSPALSADSGTLIAPTVAPPTAAATPSQTGALAATLEVAEGSDLELLGVNRHTFAWLGGWPHVQQSIENLFTTRILTRVFRREYGSDIPRLIDHAPDDRTLLAVQVAMTAALVRWEPRFTLTRMVLASAAATGQIGLECGGIYYPRWGVRNGELWVDRTLSEEKYGFHIWR